VNEKIDDRRIVRITQHNGSGDFICEVSLPRRVVIMSLLNDWPAPIDGSERVHVVKGAYANGDDVEVRIRRVKPQD
jgi:hypothetical protein